MKQFRVLIAHGPYVVGTVIQPTGLYRDMLLKRGIIEEVTDDAAAREAHAPVNRMIPGKAEAQQGLFTRKRGRG